MRGVAKNDETPFGNLAILLSKKKLFSGNEGSSTTKIGVPSQPLVLFIFDFDWRTMAHKLCFLIGCLLVLNGVFSHSFAVERRKAQFSNQPGYAILPAPYNLPGIGSGLAIAGTFTNIYGSYTDVFALILLGDVEGYGGGVTDLHLIPENLFVDFTAQQLSKVTAQSYSQRGMKSDKDDFVVIESDDVFFAGGRLTLSFLERQLEFFGVSYSSSLTLSKIRDQEGKIILEAESPERQTSESYGGGVVLDWTDDKVSPRKGFRLNVSRTTSPPANEKSPNFFVDDYNATFYIPVGKISTWVFNYFISNAIVARQGLTNRDELSLELGLNCQSIPAGTARNECWQTVDNRQAANRYGSSVSLGGRSRLRSFPQGRYTGAHTAFYGTEFRWNLTEESTPYDLILIKDIRTAVQLAIFYEEGSIADKPQDLWVEKRNSAGLGLRLVTGSGLVYRADYAVGNEGGNFTLILNYPWETF